MITLQVENWLFMAWLSIMVIQIFIGVYNIWLRIKIEKLGKKTDAKFEEAINKLSDSKEK